MTRKIRIARVSEDIVLSIGTDKRSIRFYMTEDQAQHLSNRLQSFAKGGFGFETVLSEGES